MNATDGATLTTKLLANSGLIQSAADLSVSTTDLSNSGSILHTGIGRINVSVAGQLTSAGKIVSNGGIALRTGAVNLAGGTLSTGGVLDATVTERFVTGRGGTILAERGARIAVNRAGSAGGVGL